MSSNVYFGLSNVGHSTNLDIDWCHRLHDIGILCMFQVTERSASLDKVALGTYFYGNLDDLAKADN